MNVQSGYSGMTTPAHSVATATHWARHGPAIGASCSALRLTWLTLSIMLLAACSPTPPATAPRAVRVFDTPLQLVERNTVLRRVPIPGNVVASREILVASKISGYLRRIPVEEGQEVSADQVLAEIDPAQIEGAVAQSEATVKSAQASVSDAARDLARQRLLHDKGMVSEAAFNKATLHLNQVQAELERARSQLYSNVAERAYTRITSPVRARVVQRLRQPGDLATPGQPMLRLQALEGIQFEADVPAHLAGMLALGQRLDVRLDGREPIVEGTLTHVIGAADPVTRTVKIKMALPRNDRIVPGTFGRVLVPQGHEAIAVIPANALVERLGVEGVFVVDAQRAVHFVSVRAGRSFEGHREILAGLTGGEQIVAAPPGGLRDGDRAARDKP